MSLDDAERLPIDVFMALLELHRRERQWNEFPVAQLTALTANLNRDKKKRRQPFAPQDFMTFKPVEREEDKAPPDPLEKIRAFDAIAQVWPRGKPRLLKAPPIEEEDDELEDDE